MNEPFEDKIDYLEGLIEMEHDQVTDLQYRIKELEEKLDAEKVRVTELEGQLADSREVNQRLLDRIKVLEHVIKQDLVEL